MQFVRIANDEGRELSVPEDMVDVYQGYKRVDAGAEKPAKAPNPEPQGDTTENELKAVTEDVRPSAADVRKWAAENDVQVNAKGKIPDDVYAKYAEAHQS